MNERQERALTKPLSGLAQSLDPYRVTRRHRTGLLLRSILAVDR